MLLENPTYRIIAISLISILFTVFSLDVGMLWDNVLFAGKMGTQLYENAAFSWYISDSIDPGHPPFLASIMAVGWTIFGRSLAVSHWLMLPFVFGLLWQLYHFVSFFVENKKLRLAAYAFVVADATLLAQFTLVGIEPIQLFFFFLALNGLLYKKTKWKIIGLAFLGIVSFRGMMLCAGIFLIEMSFHFLVEKSSIKRVFTRQRILEYTLGALPALIYITWRLLTKGWLQTHPESPWADCWHLASPSDFIRNLAVLGQRYTDFGRLFIGLFIAVSIIGFFKTLDWTKKHTQLVCISIASVFVIIGTSLIATNPMAHRYFIASYLALALLAFLLLQSMKWKKGIYATLLLVLLLGNFIVYPDKFSQGWDASLAHFPYWNLRKQAIQYMDEQEIPIEETASFFPNINTIDHVDLNNDKRSFIPFTGKEKYLLYSNLYNPLDSDFDVIEQHYTPIKRFQKNRVKIILYKQM